MLLTVAVISVAFVIFIVKYVFGNSGPNPFETDTREPLKKMVHDRKEKNKVLKQGERNEQGRDVKYNLSFRLEIKIKMLKLNCTK